MSFKEKLQKLRERVNQEKQGLSFAVFESGSKNYVRVLPLNPDTDDFYIEVRFHYQIGEKTLICPGDDCPVCAVGKKLIHSGEQNKVKTGRAFMPITRYLMKVNVRGKGLQIWNCPKGLFENEIAEYFLSDEFGAIHDLKKGRDFVVKRSGEGLGTKYTIMITANSKPAFDTETLHQEWETSKDLREIFRPTDTAELDEIASQIEIVVSEELNEELSITTERPVSKKEKIEEKKDTKKLISKKEEEEEEEEEEDEEDEEEEEEKEEEEEDEEEEDEEEDKVVSKVVVKTDVEDTKSQLQKKEKDKPVTKDKLAMLKEKLRNANIIKK